MHTKFAGCLLIAALSNCLVAALAQAQQQPSSAPISAIALELWPKGTKGCEHADLTMKFANGAVVVAPAGTQSNFDNSQVAADRKGMRITIGKPGCEIRVLIESIAEDRSR